jgi:uncharacterized protein (TIGR03083 family)
MMTRDGHLDRVQRGWAELEEVVGGLDTDALQAPVADGWTVKDHLSHLAAWEESLLALLEGRDRAEAMAAPGMEDEGVDAINAVVWEQRRGDAPAEALARLRETHGRLVARLEALSDEDFSRPYSYFQPDAADEQRPVTEWIAGNTWEHYEEHLDWLREPLGRR